MLILSELRKHFCKQSASCCISIAELLWGTSYISISFTESMNLSVPRIWFSISCMHFCLILILSASQSIFRSYLISSIFKAFDIQSNFGMVSAVLYAFRISEIISDSSYCLRNTFDRSCHVLNWGNSANLWINFWAFEVFLINRSQQCQVLVVHPELVW